MDALKVVRRDADPTCPYCKERIVLVEEAAPCERCGTAHHVECSRELTRCTVLGCGGKLAGVRPRAPTTAGSRRDSWWDGLGTALGIIWFVCEVVGGIVQLIAIFV